MPAPDPTVHERTAALADRILDEEGHPDPGALHVIFANEGHQLMFPVTAEIYVSAILDRAEFRKHCDTHRTRSAILAHLH
jgi:hypothetical protein